MATETPRLLYIMGTARSGSTILEILLSHGERSFGAGELSLLLEDALLADRPCTCGARASQCPVWGAVAERLGWDRAERRHLAAVFRQVEWHSGFPRLLLGRTPSPTWRAWVEANRALLDALHAVTGADLVIDASKYAGRALALDRALPGRLAVVCLTRSPGGLLRSFARPNQAEQQPKTSGRALAYYLWTTATLRAAAARIEAPVLFLRYEDLVRDPGETLRHIEGELGVPTGRARDALEREEPLDPGHLVTGNRLRHEAKIRFRPDSAARPDGLSSRLAWSAMEGWRRLLAL